MSNDSYTFYVGDLKRYMTIRFDDDVDPMGYEVLGFNNVFLDFLEKSNYDWYSKRAKKEIKKNKSLAIYGGFLKTVVSIGAPAAIKRYAWIEKISYQSAVVATFHTGIRALISNFFLKEGVIISSFQVKYFDTLIKDGLNYYNLTAYDKTKIIRLAIVKIFLDKIGDGWDDRLRREELRKILSLIRLYYSFYESKVIDESELLNIFSKYELKENLVKSDDSYRKNKKLIKNWKLRHIKPFFYYYPPCIRFCFDRMFVDILEESYRDEDKLINEMAYIMYILD